MPNRILAVVRLDLLDVERRLREDVIDELDRDFLVVAGQTRRTHNRVQSLIVVYWQ